MNPSRWFASLLCVSTLALAEPRPPIDYRAEVKRIALSKAPDVPSRIRVALTPLFQAGITKEQTIAHLCSKFQLTDKDITITTPDRVPLEVVREGRTVKLSCWANAPLVTFRSLRSLGTKNYVSAQFDFDERGLLSSFRVSVAYGPEL